MLVELRSEVFREKLIRFGPGLNVVLGDDNASNSIGKSTLLMVVDFMLGGNSLLEHHDDLVEELGNHYYEATFVFGEESFRFRRRTDSPKHVFVLTTEGERAIPLERYTALLKNQYGIPARELTLRSALGPYSRIWGKDTALDVHHPLHASTRQSSSDAIDVLIKLFAQYDALSEIAAEIASNEESLRSLRSAYRSQLLLKIGKRVRAENDDRIEEIRREIDDIKSHLALYATTIGAIVNREVVELKERKDRLLGLALELRGSLSRVDANLSGNRHIKSKSFEQVRDFFPEIDLGRVAKVEEFHDSIAKILRAELTQTSRDLTARLSLVDDEIADVDRSLASALSSVDNPSVIVDRVLRLSSEFSSIQGQNRYFDKEVGLVEGTKLLASNLAEMKGVVLAEIQSALNDEMQLIVSEAFGALRKPPTITLHESSYDFDVFEDTGTGVAFWALIIFDLAVLSSTALPNVIHDSLLFKNIETDTVSSLLTLYARVGKQSFIAIDEAPKYGEVIASMLRARAVVQLSDDALLYTKDWRSKRRRSDLGVSAEA